MPKTLPPGVAPTKDGAFICAVKPDVFDERDLEYRPQLHPLPPVMDVRGTARFVLTQEGNSCTGHAVAAMINTVLADTLWPMRVSPYMLYSMARRYDEFEGLDDAGSSLRGALKGWFYHGVLAEADWPRFHPEPDIDRDPVLSEKAMQHPLGAFYRVNAFRLDDLQSAVNELRSIAVSAQVHSGWLQPRVVERLDGSSLYLIERTAESTHLGGHAFAIVGYNEIGFLVQNSWGPGWGRNGFATLPYEDWLTSAYDAWVARPGVPSSVNLRNITRVVTTTSGGVSQGPGPDLVRLQGHLVNLGNEGRLSTSGRFISTPAQIDQIFEQMATTHQKWAAENPTSTMDSTPRVVFYAHGGLVSEGSGLVVAQKQLNWWMNNHIYPVFFAWQTGPVETMVDQIVDMLRDKLPFGSVGFDLVEQADRFVERFARSHLTWLWTQMKQNAVAASLPLPGPADWSMDTGSAAQMASMPGASLVANRLGTHIAKSPGQGLEVHLVGHSAGSIFTANFLSRLLAEKVDIASISWLAPAIRVDDFARLVLPAIQSRHVARFASFGMRDKLELDDSVGSGFLKIYQKSLLYLVSRGLEERSEPGSGEVPLLGMQRFASGPLGNSTVTETLEELGAELIWSPSETPAMSRTSSNCHGGFDDDSASMTSVMLRILNQQSPGPQVTFRSYAPEAASTSAEHGEAAAINEQVQIVDVGSSGEVPVSTMGSEQSLQEPAPTAHDGDTNDQHQRPTNGGASAPQATDTDS